ncbi:MAG: (S)-ureidoglycine aminohydrolase [Planctomycetaceae bacterium]|nr:(S)-ureidoglycine aminohydrolase [Planctomycetaceae bacterium]
MNPLGHTRSVIANDHALITPDTHVWAALPGWSDATAAVHISPAMGAEFLQATLTLNEGAVGDAPPAGIERFLYVLAGVTGVAIPGHGEHELHPGHFAYLPAGCDHRIAAVHPSLVVVFEKRYTPGPGDPPEPIVGDTAEVAGEPFMGDEDAQLQQLLPDDDRYDMACNVFTYQPGAALPQVEVHVMEHGLLMLDGAGIYRLGDAWYPVGAGDVIWMRAYCPQWFAAIGKEPARYLYYKNVNRDALGVSGAAL